MAIEDDVLVHMKPEPFGTISRRVRDGDLLLCAGNDPFSQLIGWSTKSPWTHVAIAYRWPSLGRIMAFEAVQQIGVRTVPLQTFVRQSSTGQKPYPGKIILARHEDFAANHGKHTSAKAEHFADFAIDRFGDHFAPMEIAKIALRITLGRLNRNMPKFMGPKNEFICSEYVAKCFERVGITIPWDGLGFIAPADFANDPKIKAIGRFPDKLRPASATWKGRRPMKYWIDTEFIERPFNIDLISIGIVAENSREFYAESSEVDWSTASSWTLQTVKPQLDGKAMPREQIGYAIRNFTDGDEHPVFWGYFPAYDWVAFSWLFGTMTELPFHYPQMCLDIKQWAIELGDVALPQQVGQRHHALADARWTRDAWTFLAGLNPKAAERRAKGQKYPDQYGAKADE